ncbi:hypothetical protein [Leptobacterium sp. I13]
MKSQKADNSQKKPFKIPVNGALGLLAYGDIGLREWRKVRDQHRNKKS